MFNNNSELKLKFSRQTYLIFNLVLCVNSLCQSFDKFFMSNFVSSNLRSIGTNPNIILCSWSYYIVMRKLYYVVSFQIFWIAFCCCSWPFFFLLIIYFNRTWHVFLAVVLSFITTNRFYFRHCRPYVQNSLQNCWGFL